MSSRRGSIVATAESSAQGSRASTPAESAVGAIDTIVEETDDDVVAALKRDVGGGGGADMHGSSFIQRHARLDIAFLHAISTHRPLGAHKHFNLIPVLALLDRAVRQIEADARDQEARDADEEDDDSDTDVRRRSVKRETTEPPFLKPDGSQALHITPAMIWQRLGELYDTEGLDELEDQAIDADSKSPFNKVPDPTYVSHITRKVLGNAIDVPPAYGFGSKLERLPNVAKAPSKPEKKKARSKAAAVEKEDDDDDEDMMIDFELGPWEEYESIVASRRLDDTEEEGGVKATNGDIARLKRGASRQQSVTTDASIDDEEGDSLEDEEEDEDGDEGEEEEDGEEGDEEEEDDTEEEERKPTKRKAAPASTKKQGPASRQKRHSGGNTAASTTPTPTRSSRGAASKPRRSARR